MAKKDTAPQNDAPQNDTPEVETVSTAPAADDRVAELTSDLQRLQAEFINFKRRAEDERSELTAAATRRVLRELLPVRDNFDRELAGRPAGVDAAWAASIDAIRNQFDQSLRALGVGRFNSVGSVFDPNRHEAVADAGGEGEFEVVANELQAGYLQGDRVLRPAMVRVAHTDESPVKSGAVGESGAAATTEPTA
jgi:molecular chaperone GrpE